MFKRSSIFFVCLFFMGCEGVFSESECDNGRGDMVLIKSGGVLGYEFYIDRYEATRMNASASDEGSYLGKACSIKGRVPWQNVNFNDAISACRANGKRLCTEAEWRFACSEGQLNYPYGNDYVAGHCQAGEVVDFSLTGALEKCKSPSGVMDMSGNVREWVEGGKRMGGSFQANEASLRCDSVLGSQDADLQQISRSDGFRCCSDVTSI